MAPGLPWRTRFFRLFVCFGSSPAQALPPLFKRTMNFKSFEFEYPVTHNIPVKTQMWLDLESVIQTEVSQEGKNKHHVLTRVCALEKGH